MKAARAVGGKFKPTLRGSSVVLLEPDVAKAFPDAESVNAALRLLLSVAASAARKPRPKRAAP